MTDKKNTDDKATKNKPSHRVTFRKNGRKADDGTVYREQTAELGAGWKNDKGGISFPMMGGWVTLWPIEAKGEGA